MLLENKNAVIYGAGGAVGGAVARAFAREGARVFLVGRTLATLDTVAHDITAAGGSAETAQVDALDREAVERHLAAMIKQAGSVDISFNLIGLGGAQGAPFFGQDDDQRLHAAHRGRHDLAIFDGDGGRSVHGEKTIGCDPGAYSQRCP